MGAILSFFAAGPARIQALLVGAMAFAITALALLAWGFWWRAEAYQARAERDRERVQVTVLASAVNACNAGVDQAKRVGDAAVATGAELLEAARKLKAPQKHTIERIETVIERPRAPGEGCDWAWSEIEAQQRKAGAAQ